MGKKKLLADSQMAIKVIRRANIKSDCVKICKQTITRLSVGNSVNIIWVLSHIGIDGNEQANRQVARSWAGRNAIPLSCPRLFSSSKSLFEAIYPRGTPQVLEH